MGLLILPGLFVLLAASVWAVVAVSGWWLIAAVPLGLLFLLGVYDVLQRRHSILRNYPVLGHLRFLLEKIRPEIQQYFIERNYDGRPVRPRHPHGHLRAGQGHPRRAGVRHRAGRQRGRVRVRRCTRPPRCDPPDDPPRVRVGGPDCTQPYDMALLNVSAMSFGALSRQRDPGPERRRGRRADSPTTPARAA